MDYQVDSQVLLKVPLDIVNDVVADHHILAGGHLTVNRSKYIAGAVIVHRQVMKAQDPLIAEDFGIDLIHHFLVGSRAQEGVTGLDYQLNAGNHDKEGDDYTQVPIQIDPGPEGKQRPRQDRCRGKHVVAAINPCGGKGGGLDFLPDSPIKAGLPKLDENRRHQGIDQDIAELDLFGIDNLDYRALHQLHAQDNYDEGDDQAGYVF